MYPIKRQCTNICGDGGHFPDSTQRLAGLPGAPGLWLGALGIQLEPP